MKNKLLLFFIILFLTVPASINSKNQSSISDSLSKSLFNINSHLDSIEKNIINLSTKYDTLIHKQNEISDNLKALEVHSELITNFIISIAAGIIAGIIASLIWLLLQNRNHKKKLKRILEPLVGTYSVLDIQNENIVEGAKIYISYKSGNVVETMGITTEKGEWRGRLVIDEHSPDWGSGFYRYYIKGSQGNENGLHRVIIDRENNRIYVNIEVFTHEKSKTKALIWEKCN